MKGKDNIMLKHIIMWRIEEEYEGMSKEEIINKIDEGLNNLKGIIPEIEELEVGINKNFERPIAYDAVLYSTFKDFDALNKYAIHPEHVKVAEFIKKVITDSALVDYII
jgi:hypothetical protein